MLVEIGVHVSELNARLNSSVYTLIVIFTIRNKVIGNRTFSVG